MEYFSDVSRFLLQAHQKKSLLQLPSQHRSPIAITMSHARIVHLAHIISTNAQAIDAQLSAKGLPSPSFDPETPDDLLYGHGEEFEAARQAMIEATGELKMLVEGPRESVMGMFVR